MANEMKFWKESWTAVILPFKLEKKKKKIETNKKGRLLPGWSMLHNNLMANQNE